jgi:hypothetical protein
MGQVVDSVCHRIGAVYVGPTGTATMSIGSGLMAVDARKAPLMLWGDAFMTGLDVV